MKRLVRIAFFTFLFCFCAIGFSQSSGPTAPPPPYCTSANAGAIYTNTSTNPPTVFTCSYYNLAWQWVVNPSYGGLVYYPTLPTTCSGALPVFLSGWPHTQEYVCVNGVPDAIGGAESGVTVFTAPRLSWPSWLTPTVTTATTTPNLAVAASTIPFSAGGTNATFPQGAATNIVDGNAINPSTIGATTPVTSITAGNINTNGVYQINGYNVLSLLGDHATAEIANSLTVANTFSATTIYGASEGLTGNLSAASATVSGELSAGTVTANTVIVGTTYRVGVGSYSDLQTAISGCGSANACAFHITGNIVVTANTTIPANVAIYCEGGLMLPNTGVTVTIGSGMIVNPTNQVCFGGSGSIAGLIVSYPEWFGGTTSAAVLAAYNALVSTGSTLVLQPNTTYVSPWTGTPSAGTTVSKNRVRISGGGMPDYNSGYTALIGGTIITGTVTITGNYPIVENLGIDASSSCVEGLFVSNGTGSGILSPIASPVVRNVSILMNTSSCARHASLNENTINAYYDNVKAVGAYYGHVIKSNNFVGKHLYACNNISNGVYVKADSQYSGNISNINVSDVIIDNACGTAGAGMTVEAQTASMSNVFISQYYSSHVTGNALALIGDSSSYVLGNVHVAAMTSDNAGNGCDYITANTYGIQINGLTCNVSVGVGISNSSSGINFANITIANSPTGGIYTGGNNVAVDNLQVYGSSGTATPYAIQAYGGTVTVGNAPIGSYVTTPFFQNGGLIVSNVTNNQGVILSPTTQSNLTSMASATFTATGGKYTSTTTNTISALSTPTALTGSGSASGILVLRDNTLGGAAMFLIDPNGGSQLIGTSQITGLSTAAGITYSGGNWNVALSSGTVPRVIAWIIM